MAEKRATYHDSSLVATQATKVPVLFGAAADDDKFQISSYTLNQISVTEGDDEQDDEKQCSFPGNISPEGYFYSPFYEVQLKELDDELQFINTKRINFNPSDASTTANTREVDFYDGDIGITLKKNMSIIEIKSPIAYNIILGQPFSIYDIDNDSTYRGFISAFTKSDTGGYLLTIATESNINASMLRGTNSNGKSNYIISLMEENAPEYAEYLPASGKLVWRGPKKMSDLESNSPLYNMPFTNGRLYIHRNINVFVRRQDPHGGFRLYRPSQSNPLRRFQIEGDAKLDFDYIQTIIDSMVDAC